MTILVATVATSLAAMGPCANMYDDGHQSCAACHDRNKVAAGERPGPAVCASCHSPDSAGAATHGFSAHFDSAGSGTCMNCHDPHATEPGPRLIDLPATNPDEVLLDPVSRICAQCHVDEGVYGGIGDYRRHPVGMAPPGGAPEKSELISLPLIDVRGTESRHDDVISCITCHTTHERRELYLLRWEGREQLIAACTVCHAVGGDPRGAERLVALSRLPGPRRREIIWARDRDRRSRPIARDGS